MKTARIPTLEVVAEVLGIPFGDETQLVLGKVRVWMERLGQGPKPSQVEVVVAGPFSETRVRVYDGMPLDDDVRVRSRRLEANERSVLTEALRKAQAEYPDEVKASDAMWIPAEDAC